jgi:hypothetical protein
MYTQAKPKDKSTYIPGLVRNHPGYEGIGLARDFCRRIEACDKPAFDVIKRTFAMAKEGFTGRTPKPGYLIALQRSWNDMPLTGTIIAKVTRDKAGLHMTTVRLSATRMRVSTWTEGTYAHGLSMSLLQMEVSKSICACEVQGIAFIGHHSLSRFYQRGGTSLESVTDAVLMNALGRIFIAYSSIVESPDIDFTVQAGVVRGVVCVVKATGRTSQ